MPVSARFLFQGAWYSSEQAGRLLHNAVTLYDLREFSTAVGIALLAREELGKARILIDLWKQCQGGKVIEIRDLETALGNHGKKQMASQTSTSLLAPPKLVERMLAASSEEDRAAAWEPLKELLDRKAKRAPDDRHLARQQAFYVDPDQAGTFWNRPCIMDAVTAIQHITEASNAYSHFLPYLTDPSGELGEALNGWPERPALPDAVWPKDVSG